MIIFGSMTENDDWIFCDGANDWIFGLGGNDIISGGGGNDLLIGNNGNDTFIPGLGLDNIFGGSLGGEDTGIDTVSYSTYASGVYVALYNGYGYQKSLGMAVDKDALYGIENITGSPYADDLTGDDKANTISGGGGNDTIDGWEGDDILRGGDGNDTISGWSGKDTLDGGAGNDHLHGNSDDDILTGGTGADTFHVVIPIMGENFGRDTITDFTHEDTIALEFFGGPVGFIGERNFRFTGTAQIRYEHPHGGGTLIQIDSDGDTTVNKEIFLTSVVTLTVDDFLF